MRNIDRLYSILRDFQDEREALRMKHEQAIVSLEQYKGSEYYTRRLREENQAYTDGLEAAQTKAADALHPVLQTMDVSLSKRKIAAPSEEVLRLLTAAKMRDHLTRDELDAIANSCDGCGIALDVVADLARANGFSGMRYLSMASNLSTAAGLSMLDELRDGIRSFLKSDIARPAAAMAKRAARLGQAVDTENMPRRGLFDSVDACMFEVCRWSREAVRAFSEAVEGTE